MHELRMLRDKCVRLASSFENSEYRADPCGDGYEVRLSTPSNSAVYRGSGDECWEWLRGTSNGRLLGRGTTVAHDRACNPTWLAPTGRARGKLTCSAKRIWARSFGEYPKCVGKSPAGPFVSFFPDGNDTCDNVYAFLCGTVTGLPQGELEGRERTPDGPGEEGRIASHAVVVPRFAGHRNANTAAPGRRSRRLGNDGSGLGSDDCSRLPGQSACGVHRA